MWRVDTGWSVDTGCHGVNRPVTSGHSRRAAGDPTAAGAAFQESRTAGRGAGVGEWVGDGGGGGGGRSERGPKTRDRRLSEDGEPRLETRDQTTETKDR